MTTFFCPIDTIPNGLQHIYRRTLVVAAPLRVGTVIEICAGQGLGNVHKVPAELSEPTRRHLLRE